MKITVLGGTRFIGFALVEELGSAGHSITVVHRWTTEPADLPACEHVHLPERIGAVRQPSGKADVVIDMRAMTAADARAVLDAVPAGVCLVVGHHPGLCPRPRPRNQVGGREALGGGHRSQPL